MSIARSIDVAPSNEPASVEFFLPLPQVPPCGKMLCMERDVLKTKKLPDSPGVYLFKKGRSILYIGKATSLRDRVRSYFSPTTVASRGARIVNMVSEASSVSVRKTDSVLEALILEARLIKEHQPPYNVDEKDDKSFNYVVITKEEFPRVILVRGRELLLAWEPAHVRNMFGPFPEGKSLKEALTIIRKIFPFRDNCTPNSGKPCFNAQIGLCPGVCAGRVGAVEYRRTVAHIKEMFSGNFKGLSRTLTGEMKKSAMAEEFERAALLRRQIYALKHIRDVSLIREDRHVDKERVRIEGYDVAHTSGMEVVGVMTVVAESEPRKSAYRKFKVRNDKNDDVVALKEVLTRRLAHSEWPLPGVIVVDGGRLQLRAAMAVLRMHGTRVPVVGVVKDVHHKPERLIGDVHAIAAYQKDILLVNAEAHRFAVAYHRKLRGRMI